MTRKRKRRPRKKSSPKRGRDVKKTTKRKASSSPTRQGEKEGEGARVQSALKLFFFSNANRRARVVFFFCLFSKRMLRALLTSDTVVWRWTHESLRARALLLALSFRSSVRSASNGRATRRKEGRKEGSAGEFSFHHKITFFFLPPFWIPFFLLRHS